MVEMRAYISGAVSTSGEGSTAMAIRSDAFGRVTLTGDDAKKFQAQVTYGRPSKAAKDTAKQGVEVARRFSESGGKLKVALEPAK